MLIRICPDQTLAMRTILKNSEPLSIQAFRSKCLIYLFVQACILGVCASGSLASSKLWFKTDIRTFFPRRRIYT